MPINYSDIDEAAALRDRLEALSTAKSALEAADARQPLGLVMSPNGASNIPGDTADLTIASDTDAVDWSALIGFPASLRTALTSAVIDWLTAEMAGITIELEALGADMTGAPV